MRIRWMVWAVVLLALACGAIPVVGQGGSPLRDVLLPEGCEQACYLGIRPGITTPDEARIILDEANREYEYGPMTLDPHTAFYSYAVRATGYPFAGQGTSIFINVFIDTNEIPQISIVKPVESTVEEIVSEFGQPTRIIVRNQVEIVYEDYLLSFFVSEDNEHIDSIAILSPETFDFAFNDPDLENLQPCDEPATLCDIALASPPPTTPTPTAPAVSEDTTPADLRRLLSDPGCQTACFLGIEPGVTTEDELLSILTTLNISYSSEPWSIWSIYKLVPGDSSITSERVVVDIRDGIVDKLFINLDGVTIADVLSSYGAPERILDTGVIVVLTYPQRGLQFDVLKDTSSVIDAMLMTETNIRDRIHNSYEQLEPCIEPVEICSITTATPSEPTATPRPTAPAVSEEATPADLRRLLSGPRCQAACFLGIEPMRTSRTQLERTLNERHIEFEVDPLGLNAEIDTAPVLFYRFPIEDISPFIQYEGGIQVVVGQEVVTGPIYVPLRNTTIDNVLEWYGTPGGIVYTGSAYAMVYPSLGLTFVTASDEYPAFLDVYLVEIGDETWTRQSFLEGYVDIHPCIEPAELCSIVTETSGHPASSGLDQTPPATPSPTAPAVSVILVCLCAPRILTRDLHASYQLRGREFRTNLDVGCAATKWRYGYGKHGPQ